MHETESHFSICPMCGTEYRSAVTKPVRHRVECLFCGERFEIDGNPEALLPEFRRPFWSDQFRKYRDDADREELPAAVDALMIVIAGGATLFVVAATALSVAANLGWQ